MSTEVLSTVAEATDQAVAKLDLDRLHRDYWDQNEFLFIPQFLPREFVEASLVPQAQGVKGQLNRNYIPGHKKGGSVSYYTVQEKAPLFLDLYRSPAFLTFLSRLTEAELSALSGERSALVRSVLLHGARRPHRVSLRHVLL